MSIIPKLAGVCGWPIHHSLSPLLHSYWLRETGVKGAYIPFAVRQDEAVKAFRSLKHTSIVGVNVTLPLKAQAFEAADDVTDDARKLGVSNCLFKRHGKLIAHNTDMEGFAAPLLARIDARKFSDMTAVIIGAGGASRAVIGALFALGISEIRIINRTDRRAEDLVASINVPSFYTLPWAQREMAMTHAGLIINASSAGMAGNPDLDISLKGAPNDALVYDLVYTPEVTGLIQTAKDRGLDTLGGLDMLIAQARPSFKLFYGQLPPKDLDPTDLLRRNLSK